MTIYLLRHGQTEWNKLHLAQGQNNVPLNQTGIDEAKQVYDSLKNIKFDYVYSSPLERAYQTASIVAKDNLIIKDDLLMEIDFGNYQKRNCLTAQSDKSDPIYSFFCDPDNYIPSGGETFLDVRLRSEQFFNKINKNFKNKDVNILVVSHSVFIRSTILNVEGLPTKSIFSEIEMGNCQITKLDNNLSLI